MNTTQTPNGLDGFGSAVTASMTRLGWVAAAMLVGCGAGVPIQLRVDQATVDLSLEDGVDALAEALRSRGVLPPEALGIPEVWPEEFSETCLDFLVMTDPDLGGRIDLTPDPNEDPQAAELFSEINDGIVERIELDALVLRVERNSLNVPLPPIEVQIADAIDAHPDDNRAWRTVGTVGRTPPTDPCAPGAILESAVDPGEVADVELRFDRGGESYLNNQLGDERCLEDGKDPLRCKEFSLRARARVVFDTRKSRDRPRGEVSLRLILVATFFVDPT